MNASSTSTSSSSSFTGWSYCLSILSALFSFCLVVFIALPIHVLQSSIYFTWFLYPHVFYEWFISGTQICFIEIVILIHTLFSPPSYLYLTSNQLTKFIHMLQHQPAFYVPFPMSSFFSLKTPLPSRLKRAILISNHLTLLDWIYIWMLAYFLGEGHAIKIILKSSLKKVPLFGTGMIIFNFIFLTRNWKRDQPYFLSALTHFKSCFNQDLWLLIFPEGTLLTQNRIEANLEYSKKSGIPAHSHSLIPRSTGLYAAIQTLSPSIPHILNITLGYSEVNSAHLLPAEIHTPFSIYGQRCPPTYIFLDVQVLNLNTEPNHNEPHPTVEKEKHKEKEKGEAMSLIPYKDKALFETWLLNLFQEKSHRLYRLQSQGQWKLTPHQPFQLIPIHFPSMPWTMISFYFISWLYILFLYRFFKMWLPV